MLLLERVCGERKLYLAKCIMEGEINFGKRFLKCEHSHYSNTYASLTATADYILQNSGGRKTILLVVH